MTIPEDLKVLIANGELRLLSGEKEVTLSFAGRQGVFRDGPIAWKRLLTAYIEPALWQFTNKK